MRSCCTSVGTALLHVLVLRCDVEVLKHVREELEGRPLERVPVPAFDHNLERKMKEVLNFFRLKLGMIIYEGIKYLV